MYKFGVIPLCLVVLLAGCARSPEKIPAATVSSSKYETQDCEGIRTELAKVEADLVRLYARQRKTRSNDALGVFLLGLPVSSMSGKDVSDQVARLKGEQQSLRKVGAAKQCELPDPPDLRRKDEEQ